MRLYFTSHPVHVGRHVVGVLRGPESEIGVLVVTVALVVFGRHRHQDFVVLRNVCYNPAVAAADRGTRTSLYLIIFVNYLFRSALSLPPSLSLSSSGFPVGSLYFFLFLRLSRHLNDMVNTSQRSHSIVFVCLSSIR